MKVAVVIPARLASTRFPAKPLALIKGQPLIWHAVARVLGSKASQVVLATDSKEIEAAVSDLDCEVFMSSQDHDCGTDRIAEAAREIDADYIVNVQGDQLVPGPELIDTVINKIDAKLERATLYADIGDPALLSSQNVVKVVANLQSDIVYMSRLPVPFNKGADELIHFMQVGIYVFAREKLLEFSSLKPTQLETAEGVELLRALDHGLRLVGIRTTADVREVNIPADIGPAERFVDKYPLRKTGEVG